MFEVYLNGRYIGVTETCLTHAVAYWSARATSRKRFELREVSPKDQPILYYNRVHERRR